MSATNTGAASAYEHRGFVDTKAAARHVSLHRDTLRKLRRVGGGPIYTRIGRAIRYDLRELERWMADRSFAHTAEELTRERTAREGARA